MTITKKRPRRTTDQMIADLESEIRRVKARSAAEEAKASPDGKAFLSAVKALDKAIETVRDNDLLHALEAARAPLSEQMIRAGMRTPDMRRPNSLRPVPRGANGRKRVRRKAADLEATGLAILGFVETQPGKRIGEIANALRKETKAVRGPLFRLLEAGRLRSEGERGGTRYFLA